ncbi:hypothetical protein DFS34DRAFT_615536 [Phlyctochytrium arcticum]|nr:hypothetical protein DFS34DRAFT_615536 [Phlyctochytrium arcticum]
MLPNLTEAQLADLLIAVNRESHLAGRPSIDIPELMAFGGCYLVVDPIPVQVQNVYRCWDNKVIDVSPENLRIIHAVTKERADAFNAASCEKAIAAKGKRDSVPGDGEGQGNPGMQPGATRSWASVVKGGAGKPTDQEKKAPPAAGKGQQDSIDDCYTSDDEEDEGAYKPVLVDLYEVVEKVEAGVWPVLNKDVPVPW